MFPEYEPIITTSDSNSETSQKGKSFLFDFEKGDFVVKDGKLQSIEGIEAIKVWIQKVLKTEKFKFKIYNTGQKDEYGVTILEFIYSDYPQIFIQAEIQREITEALLKNTNILNVQNFSFKREKRILFVSFDVNSIYGTSSQEVSF